VSAGRPISLTGATALVVANMIGAGVFTTSGLALADLGQRHVVLAAWAVGGLLALCGALSYGALARRIPQSGGEYTFLSQTVHPLAGFLAGWVSLLAGFTAPIALAGLGLQAYLADSVGTSLRPEWIGTAAIGAAALLHGLRLRAGVLLQSLAVALKLALIAGFIVLGAVLVPSPPTGLAPSAGVGVGAFAVSLVWISFSYSGWNAAVYVAGEVQNPRTNLPRALLVATVAVTATYLALNAVFLYSTHPAQLAGRVEVGAIAAEALGGPWLRRAVSGVVALALFTSISSMVMSGPRVYARMAEDGLFPRLFARGTDAPGAAVALQAALSIGVLWFSGLAELLGYIGVTLGLSSAGTVGALIALRIREGPERVPVPGYPWVPALFVSATLAMTGFMAVREPTQVGIALATLAAGTPLYLWMRRDRPRPDFAPATELEASGLLGAPDLSPRQGGSA
jgi:APA family basic amino acid/polyamine antiporter